MPEHSAAAGSPSRLITIYQIMFVVLLWNSAYKGVRVLNTLYALELGATPLHIGLLLATYGVFPLLLAVKAGRIADRYGSGRLRLTVWQNFLIPDVRNEDIPAVQREIEAAGLEWNASSFRAGLVACTGNAGCKFAGVTVHQVTAELDVGPILDQAVVPVLPDDTADTLAARVLTQEHVIYPRAVRALLQTL